MDTYLHASQHSLCLTIFHTTQPTEQLHSSVLRDAVHTNTSAHSYSHTRVTTTRPIQSSTQNYTHLTIIAIIYVYNYYVRIIGKYGNGNCSWTVRYDSAICV